MNEPILEISGLSKSFGALRATDNVSLDLGPGEIHALIGPNGAGKSTLIHQIAGTLKPDDGVIRFLGREVNEAGPVARARMGLGRSFQVSSLAPEFSALRNVMLAVQSRQGRVRQVKAEDPFQPCDLGPGTVGYMFGIRVRQRQRGARAHRDAFPAIEVSGPGRNPGRCGNGGSDGQKAAAGERCHVNHFLRCAAP